MKNIFQRLWPFGRKNDGTLELFRQLYGGRASKAGPNVDFKTALQVATVFACVRVIADGVAQVPLKLFRESADGKSREPAKDHPLYWILFRKPNPWQSSFQYRETLVLHTALVGNHYSFINRVRGKIVELLPLDPSKVCVKRDESTYELSYEVTATDGSKKPFPYESIWHVRGPSWNSWMGLECVQLAREAIGLSMAIEEQQGGLYKNGVQSSGTLSVEGNLTEDQYKKLRKWLDDEHASSSHAYRAMIVDRAAKWIQTSMTSVDAQTLEQRRYQVEEVCRPFRVMPIMVGYSDKTATYASAEQMFLAHVVHTLSPWYERIEQDINGTLLTEADVKAGIYAKFIEEGLLRGALRDTADYLQRLTTAGIMTRNEARAKLDMNPLDGLDEPLTPVNMVAGEPPHVGDNAPDPNAQPKNEVPPFNFTIEPGAIKIDMHGSPTTINTPPVTLNQEVNVPEREVKIENRAGDVSVEVPPAQVTVQHPKSSTQEIERDKDKEISVIKTKFET